MENDLFEQYKYLYNEQCNVRETIDGELNRIAITHDNDERIEMCKHLQINILKYIAVSISVVEVRKLLNKSIQKTIKKESK